MFAFYVSVEDVDMRLYKYASSLLLALNSLHTKFSICIFENTF